MEFPKIVQIETRYVQTDSVNFKDVVQSLTGKNSSMDSMGWPHNAAATHSSSSPKEGIPDETNKLIRAPPSSYGTNKYSLLPSSMQINNNLSFKDFYASHAYPHHMMPWPNS
ncbi:hypothetical protein VNO78_04044 [Psophocarpus tetragonolobus]|uniref:VQ domain-containing protein n=1 Tax=Psophocarpus tetragonolobus TaxID=3891 RepID=A0AAN9XW34_PSOTE